jgi:hypothetical protein
MPRRPKMTNCFLKESFNMANTDDVIDVSPDEHQLPAVREPAKGGTLAVRRADAGGFMAMIDRILDAGPMTTEGAEALKTLAGVAREARADDAREAFFKAKAELSKKISHVAATREVKKRDGTLLYKYASYMDMMEVTEAEIRRNGFDISYDGDFAGEGNNCRYVASLKLSYGGHTEVYKFAVRTAPPSDMMTAAQMDMKARTTACRGALMNAFNVVMDYDDDAALEGPTISAEEAQKLKDDAIAAGFNPDSFLSLAGADSWENIRQGALGTCRAAIDKANALLQTKPGAPKPAPSAIKAKLFALAKVKGEGDKAKASAWLANEYKRVFNRAATAPATDEEAQKILDAQEMVL